MPRLRLPPGEPLSLSLLLRCDAAPGAMTVGDAEERHIVALEARIAALEAENRELRMLVQQMVGHAQQHETYEHFRNCGVCEKAMASAALKGGGAK